MKCLNCGFENEGDSKFCTNCGAVLVNDKPSFKKCVVCQSDIASDADICPTCNSKQSDYVKCLVCGEAVLNSFKFCTKCGSPVKDESFDDISTVNTFNTNTESFNVNSEPIVNIPDNSQNTFTNNGPIIDNTEVYNTNELYFEEEKKSSSKTPLIIGICVGALVLIGVVVFLFFTIFLKDDAPSNDNVINKDDETVIVDDKDDAPITIINDNDESKEDKGIEVITPVKEEYYLLDFIETVRVRSTPSTGGDNQVGKISSGTRLVAFEKVTSEGIAWYLIGPGQYVASENDDGPLVDVSRISLEKADLGGKPSAYVRTNSRTNIYDAPSNSANKIGVLADNTKIGSYGTVDGDGNTWIMIGPGEYIDRYSVDYE